MLKRFKLLITGGYSMIGRAVANNWDGDIVQASHKDFDFTDVNSTLDCFSKHSPDYVVHCAGYNGNIDFNKKYPADIFNRTVLMSMNVLIAVKIYKPIKTISMISSCAYPNSSLLIEKDFWKGTPHPSVEAHGFAKRVLVEYARQLKKQYDVNHLGLVVNTVYGPYDNFHIEKTKVMGGLIKKFSDAKRENSKSVYLWGTGKPKREFIYSEDVGKIVCSLLKDKVEYDTLLNVGHGEDISIKDLAYKIKERIGYEGEVLFDTAKQDGQMQKLLLSDYDFDFTSIDDGIKETIKWYNQHYPL
jgi:GDP-L-fucose synthase